MIFLFADGQIDTLKSGFVDSAYRTSEKLSSCMAEADLDLAAVKFMGWIIKKQESSRKTSAFTLLTMPKRLTFQKKTVENS